MIEDDELTPDAINLLLNRGAFGEQVASFFRSDVGLFVLRKIDGEIAQAMTDLCKCDPNKPLTVQELQNRVWRAENLKQWLSDAIADGIQACQILEDRA